MKSAREVYKLTGEPHAVETALGLFTFRSWVKDTMVLHETQLKALNLVHRIERTLESPDVLVVVTRVLSGEGEQKFVAKQFYRREGQETRTRSASEGGAARVPDLPTVRMKRVVQWVEDKDRVQCKICQKPFSLLLRRHHCRLCGEVVCNPCSTNQVIIMGSHETARTCDTCYASVQENRTVKESKVQEKASQEAESRLASHGSGAKPPAPLVRADTDRPTSLSRISPSSSSASSPSLPSSASSAAPLPVAAAAAPPSSSSSSSSVPSAPQPARGLSRAPSHRASHPHKQAPSRIQREVFLVLAVGLLASLLFSWYHLGGFAAALILAVVVAGFVFAYSNQHGIAKKVREKKVS